MDVLLLAFAFPVSTILLAIVLQKVLKNPLLVAATFFGILLILTYTVFDSSFLLFAVLYTILAYVTAVLTRLICNIIQRFGTDNTNSNVNITNAENNPVVVLTNANDVLVNGRNRRNCCGCNRR